MVLRNTRMAIAILAQGNSLELERASSYRCMHHSSCMQEEQEEEEQDPLFYDLPLPRLFTWTRWWHLTAKTIVLVVNIEKKKTHTHKPGENKKRQILKDKWFHIHACTGGGSGGFTEGATKGRGGQRSPRHGERCTTHFRGACSPAGLAHS